MSSWQEENLLAACGLPTSFSSSSSKNKFFPSESKRMKHKQWDRDFTHIVEQYFSKKFNIVKPIAEEWTLPEPLTMFTNGKWKVDQLQELKAELNAVKNKLNDYNLEEWHKHTKLTNKARDVQRQLRKRIRPEFITQAWCKFYELVESFPLLPEEAVLSNVLNSVHLCEAPGAFITSLNHYVQLHHPSMKMNWIATTLNPFHEENEARYMISDDRFILQTLEHWRFGADATGNLQSRENMEHLRVAAAVDLGEVMIVTADGSIDCQEDPGEQEGLVSSLHYCEAITALHLLHPGGSFLLKMFTLYECESVCLMYLLHVAFRHLSVVKPATSKEGNSEVYVVCLGYRGAGQLQPWLTILDKHYGENITSFALFCLDDIPKSFLDNLTECCAFFKNVQVAVIEENVRLYECGWDCEEIDRSQRLAELVANSYIQRYRLQPLGAEHSLVAKSARTVVQSINFEPRREVGSYNDRRMLVESDSEKNLLFLSSALASMTFDMGQSFNKDVYLELSRMPTLNFGVGKPVRQVNSSKFCYSRLLQVYNALSEMIYQPDGRPCCSEESRLPKQISGQRLHICDVSGARWQSDHNSAQSCAVQVIKEAASKLARGDSLQLVGWPLLTQFTVGIHFLLAHCFTSVSFLRPNSRDGHRILFSNLLSQSTANKILQEVVSKMAELPSHLSILSVVPITVLCDGEFYTAVVSMNYVYLRETASDMIAELHKKSITCPLEVRNKIPQPQLLDI